MPHYPSVDYDDEWYSRKGPYCHMANPSFKPLHCRFVLQACPYRWLMSFYTLRDATCLCIPHMCIYHHFFYLPNWPHPYPYAINSLSQWRTPYAAASYHGKMVDNEPHHCSRNLLFKPLHHVAWQQHGIKHRCASGSFLLLGLSISMGSCLSWLTQHHFLLTSYN